MAPTHKRVSAASPQSDAPVQRAQGLASGSDSLLGDRSAAIATALAKLAALEAEFAGYDTLDHIKRWPPIYGLSLALAFSVVAWYAVARLVLVALS